MNTDKQNNAFLDAAKTALDKQHDAIDAATQTALRNIRHQAINHAKSKPARNWSLLSPYPAMVAMTISVVAISAMLTINLTNKIDELPTLDDMALISSTDDINFYQDLEFYQWLDAENNNG